MPARGADSGGEVVVVYNSSLPQSREVADYYARARNVPADQVFGLDLPTGEILSRAAFTAQLQDALLRKLEAGKFLVFTNSATGGRGIAGASIRYLVLCYGVPTKVESDPNIVEPEAARLQPELRRNEASVDSELACLPSVQLKFIWTGPRVNVHYATTNASRMHPTNGILMVTRLDGPTPEIARGLVDKALLAERDGLWGRAYIDAGWGFGDENYQMGDKGLLGAASLARRLGFETTIDTNKSTFPEGLPLPQVAFYAGWYAGQANGPFAWGAVEFMPGAFAYHLHSFSAANLRSRNANWVGPLLALGATATMGSVYEPYLAATPDMNVFFWRFTYFGFTFGEAAWACQNSVSWQNLAVGDPLYRPFQPRPEQRIMDLERRNSPLVAWFVLMRANAALAGSGGLQNAIDVIEKSPLTPSDALLQEKLGDLYWANKQLSDGLGASGRALTLQPTRWQRLGILLRLTERLTLYGRRAEAVERYQEILRDYPQDPDRLRMYRELLALARQLDRAELIRQCEAEIQKLAPPPPPQAPANGKGK